MKYILIAALLIFDLSCEKKRDYCSECLVGNKYMLYGYFEKGNPFEKQPMAPVIITDKKDGWVQYCWEHEYEKPEKVHYARTCKEFIELTENKTTSTGSSKTDEVDIKISPGGVSIVIDSGNNNNINVQQ